MWCVCVGTVPRKRIITYFCSCHRGCPDACPSTRNARDALVFMRWRLRKPKRKATTMLRRRSSRRRRRSQRQKIRQIQTSHTEELVEQEVAQELVDQAAKAATQSLQYDMRFTYYKDGLHTASTVVQYCIKHRGSMHFHQLPQVSGQASRALLCANPAGPESLRFRFLSKALILNSF